MKVSLITIFDEYIFDENIDAYNMQDNILKNRIIQQRWKKLYNTESSLWLPDSVKK